MRSKDGQDSKKEKDRRCEMDSDFRIIRISYVMGSSGESGAGGTEPSENCLVDEVVSLASE